MLFSLQERLGWRVSHSTLKEYVALIVVHHDPLDSRSLGKHDPIIRFLRGTRRSSATVALHYEPELVDGGVDGLSLLCLINSTTNLKYFTYLQFH